MLRLMTNEAHDRPISVVYIGTSSMSNYMLLVLAHASKEGKGKVDEKHLTTWLKGVGADISEQAQQEGNATRKAELLSTVAWLNGKFSTPLSPDLSRHVWDAIEAATNSYLEEVESDLHEMYVVNMVVGQKEALAQTGSEDAGMVIQALQPGVNTAVNRMFVPDLAMFERKRTDLAVQRFMHRECPLVFLFPPQTVDQLSDRNLWLVEGLDK
jgi:hypothetical protein